MDKNANLIQRVNYQGNTPYTANLHLAFRKKKTKKMIMAAPKFVLNSTWDENYYIPSRSMLK